MKGLFVSCFVIKYRQIALMKSEGSKPVITKDEAISKLKRAGYQIAEDNSMVTVLIPASVSIKGTIKEVKSKLGELGYEASFCIRQYKDGSKPVTDRQEELEDDEENNNEIVEEEDTEELLPMEGSGQFSLGDFGIGL